MQPYMCPKYMYISYIENKIIFVMHWKDQPDSSTVDRSVWPVAMQTSGAYLPNGSQRHQKKTHQ